MNSTMTHNQRFACEDLCRRRRAGRYAAIYRHPYIRGFTTNPTLMNKAGIRDYRAFAREVVTAIPDRPISFEVFSDEFDGMERQALDIATWGPHVYVKVPVTNTRREPAYDLIRRLSHAGVKVNVTAIMTLDQVRAVTAAVRGGRPRIFRCLLDASPTPAAIPFRSWPRHCRSCRPPLTPS